MGKEKGKPAEEVAGKLSETWLALNISGRQRLGRTAENTPSQKMSKAGHEQEGSLAYVSRVAPAARRGAEKGRV